MTTGTLSAGTLMRLGRISNLPTVWSNALAGAVLAGSSDTAPILLAIVSLSLFYVGGMWLNDAFDAEIDARERSRRPIPQGEISRTAVFIGGGLFLLAGIAPTVTGGAGASLSALLLAAVILVYDWSHKHTALAPLIMGAARFLCYALAALWAARAFPPLALIGAAGLFAYVVGLTYAAKQEAYDRLDRVWPLAVLGIPVAIALWQAAHAPLALLPCLALLATLAYSLRFLFRRAPGDVPRAVTTLIAGISLYDATLLAAVGASVPALLAGATFVLTLIAQRYVAGT